jgi:hypothetical protein
MLAIANVVCAIVNYYSTNICTSVCEELVEFSNILPPSEIFHCRLVEGNEILT